MRVVLFGSPTFAVPVLRSLFERHEVALVVTQPDKPVGRGLKLTSPPAAVEAKRIGVRLEQPPRLKNEAFHDLVRDLELDVAVTAAYGKLLPPSLLALPKHGFLNVHASLLPKYRGAAPIQWALINGEKETGISIMQTEAGLDTGPVRHVEKLPILPEDNALTLFDKLSELGVEAIIEALELLEHGNLPCEPQDDAQATLAPLLTKDDGRVRWDDTTAEINNRFRGVLAWPGSWTIYQDKMLKVHGLEVEMSEKQGTPGEVLSVEMDGVTVAAGENAVRLTTVQPPNKAKMSAADWANGYHVKVGNTLGGKSNG